MCNINSPSFTWRRKQKQHPKGAGFKQKHLDDG